MFVFGIPLSFFLPLLVHVVAGLTTVITGVVAFRVPKCRGRHPRWGARYLWAYTVVFLTATILLVLRTCVELTLILTRERRHDDENESDRLFENDRLLGNHRSRRA